MTHGLKLPYMHACPTMPAMSAKARQDRMITKMARYLPKDSLFDRLGNPHALQELMGNDSRPEMSMSSRPLLLSAAACTLHACSFNEIEGNRSSPLLLSAAASTD